MHSSEAGCRYPLATPKWFFRSVVYGYRSTITLRAHFPLLNPRHSRRCSSKYYSSPFQRGLPRASSRSAFSLAVRAEVARAIHEFFPHDRCTAAVARFAAAAVDGKRSFEVSLFTGDVDVQFIEARAPGGERFLKHVARGVENTVHVGGTQRAGRAGVVQPGAPQRLVGVDVSDPGNEFLIKQNRLDPARGAPDAPVEEFPPWAARCDDGFEEIGADVRHCLGHIPFGVGVGDEVDRGDVTEHALIDEPHLPLPRLAGPLEGEAHPQVAVFIEVPLADEHLPAHPEVDE